MGHAYSEKIEASRTRSAQRHGFKSRKGVTMSRERYNARQVTIPFDDVTIFGDLSIPAEAYAVVLFAHGSGSSRFSPRNRFVADRLNDAHLATILIDLLTPEEENVDNITRQYRFDIPLLAERVLGAMDWLTQDDDTRHLAIGLFGASTGAAAALQAAARNPAAVAVVSRGGRPDLAGDFLYEVEASTLLIVGENDPVVIELNRDSLEKLACTKELVIVPGATHLFEEPGKLEEVADLTAEWFVKHLLAHEARI